MKINWWKRFLKWIEKATKKNPPKNCSNGKCGMK